MAYAYVQATRLQDTIPESKKKNVHCDGNSYIWAIWYSWRDMFKSTKTDMNPLLQIVLGYQLNSEQMLPVTEIYNQPKY